MKQLLFLANLLFASGLLAQFAPHVISTQFENASHAVLADFDSDGDLDLVFNQGNVYLLENLDGKGNFGSLRSISGPGGKYSKAVDADQDGDLDLIHAGTNSIYLSENVSGDGKEWDTQYLGRFNNTGGYNYIYFEDIDGDGDLDIANPSMAWIENTDGMFTPGEEKVIASFGDDHDVSRNIHPVDWDNDGDQDIIINQRVKVGRSQVYLLEFEDDKYSKVLLKDTIASIDALTNSVLADVDLDGDLDFVIHGGSNDIGWFANEDGAFGDFKFIHEYFDVQGDFALVDVNGDYQLDVFWCGHPGFFYTIKDNTGKTTNLIVE